jgi:hypothetical protein
VKRRGFTALAMMAGVFAGCSLPLWLLPEADEELVTKQPDVGPLRDTGVRPRSDTGSDTRPPRDTAPPDTTPPGCAYPRPSGFRCEAVPMKVGENVCTDAMLMELARDCFAPTGDSTKCSTTKAKYPACAKCVWDTWVYEWFWDSASCIRAIDPTSSCADVVRCTQSCWLEVCLDCDPSSYGADGGSEWTQCREEALLPPAGTVPTGECHALAGGDYKACESQPNLRPCFIRTLDDWLAFTGGACRDGGKWVRADAGGDVGDTD